MSAPETSVPSGIADHSPACFEHAPRLRTVLRNNFDRRRYVVVHEIGRGVWLMPCDPKPREWPELASLQTLNEVRDGYPIYELHAPSGEAAAPSSRLSDAGAERKAQINEELADTALFTTPAGRASVVRKIAAKLSLSEPACWEILRRWLASGMLPAALVAWKTDSVDQAIDVESAKELDFPVAAEACRQAGLLVMQTPQEERERVDFNLRTGKPRQRRQAEYTRFECDANAVRVIWQAIQKTQAPGVKDRDRLDWLRNEVFYTINAAGQKVAFPADAMPSIRQIRNWRQKLVPIHDRIANTRGPRWTAKNAMPMLNSQASVTTSAGGVAQIDATIWPWTIVADTPAREPIGPPVMFRVRAKNGGMYMGSHVGLEAASWAEAAAAIDDCMKDPVARAAALGIHITRESLPVQGLSSEYVADCGETYNSRPSAFVRLTGVTLTNLPADSPNLKGGVEGDFFVIQTDMNGMSPSAVIRRWEDQTKRKWITRGECTIQQFRAMHLAQELRNMKRPRQRTKLPEHLVQIAGADTSPLGIWRLLAAQNGTGLRDYSDMQEEVRISLLARETGSITEYGLLFRGVLYAAADEAHDSWYQAVRYSSSRAKVVVAFDHRLADTVYVVPDAVTPGQHVKCTLNRNVFGQADFIGKTFKEIRLIQERTATADREALEAAEEQDRYLADFQRAVRATAAQQTEAARAEFPTTANEQVRNLHAAREQEKFVQSPLTALVPRAEPPPPEAAAAAKGIAAEDQTAAQAPLPSPNVVPLRSKPPRGATAAPAGIEPALAPPSPAAAPTAAPGAKPSSEATPAVSPGMRRLLDRAKAFQPDPNKT